MSILSSLSGGSSIVAPKVVTASTYTVLSTDGLIAIRPTVTAPVTVTLEVAPTAGRAHRIEDAKGIAATNPITIVPASGTIGGQASITIDQNFGAVTIEYTGTEWGVTAIYAPDTAHATAVPALNDIGTVQLTDLDTVHRLGSGDYKATIASRHALFRQTPAGARAPTLPAVLTATDHDKNILLQGTTGTLSVDGTVSTGFRCSVINGATGAATYSGIVGLLGTSSLASGAATTIQMIGSTVYATASAGTSVSAATAYTSTIANTTGVVGSSVQVSYTPTSGVWPTSTVLTITRTGAAGTLSTSTLSAPAQSSAPLTLTFTPSAAGSATISSSPNNSLTNTTGDLTYVATAATANTYSMQRSTSAGLVGVAVTLSFAPAGGSWPGSTTLTPAVSGIAGTFSPTTLSPTGTSTVSCTFTPSAAGAGTFTVTDNQGLSDPPSLSYTASAVASAYTQALSASTGGVGAAVNFTVTPTSGGWPVGTTITPSVSPGTGTLAPSSSSPPSGSTAAIVFTYAPISAGGFSINTSVSPSMTNSSGAQTYAVAAVQAGAYTTALSAASGSIGSPVTVTFAPNPPTSVWPAGVTISPSGTPNTGTFSFSSFTPSQGTTTPLTGTFTPSSSGVYTINSTTSPTMTNSTGAVSYSSTGTAPAYPTITTGGVTLLSIIDANAGITTSSGLVTAAVDQSPSGNGLTATAGVSIGPSVNGFPSLAFASTAYSGNSGLRTSASWISSLQTSSTLAFAIKIGASVPTSGTIFNVEPNTLNYTGDYTVEFFGGGMRWFWRPNVNAITLVPNASLVANTVYKIVLRVTAGSFLFDYWINGGAKQSYFNNGSTATLGAIANLAFGQSSTASGNSVYGQGGLTGALFLEAHMLQGALSDSDVSTYQTYLTNKWGN